MKTDDLLGGTAPANTQGSAPIAAVTRFEVIDHRVVKSAPGRVFTARPCRVELSYQDGGTTLNVFVTDRRHDEAQDGEQARTVPPSNA